MMSGNKLYNMMPEIRRAREYRLYDIHGRRYLDLCLDGGRALLGHKPGRVVLMMKNALEKGLSASYPGVYEHRLLKQLQLLYPGIAGCSIVSSGGEFPVVRPFENDAAASELPQDSPFELLIPMPGSGLLSLVCASEKAVAGLPESVAVPQYMLSGLCRAAAELAAFKQVVDTDVWKAFDSPLWKRSGPWLYPGLPADKYPKLFKAFLEKGIIISVDPKIPSCAPYQFTGGEIKPIKEIERQFS